MSVESFIPALYGAGHDGPTASVLTYICGNCGTRQAFKGPAGWVPPGWQWSD